MRGTVAGVFAAILMTGCVTFGQMENGLAGLKGKPVSVATDVLGYPSGGTKIAGMNIVHWKAGNAFGYYCNIDMQVDQDDVIQGASYSGNIGGCEPYIHALNKYQKSQSAE